MESMTKLNEFSYRYHPAVNRLFMHPDPNLKSKLLFISNTSQWRGIRFTMFPFSHRHSFDLKAVPSFPKSF